MRQAEIPFGQHGPCYDVDSASLRKYRRLSEAAGGVAVLHVEHRQAYGLAVEAAILAKQRAALQRELPTHNVSCASRTNHSCGRKIGAAVREQHRTALQAAVAKERRDRTPEQWQKLYDEAMKAKRGQS